MADQTPASPSPPSVQISITQDRQTIARNEAIRVHIIVSNGSAIEVDDLTVTISNDDFAADSLPTFPPQLAGFVSAKGNATVRAKSSAQFTQQQVLFLFTYTWSTDDRRVTVMQGSPISLQVTRRFDEEAKGLLGGDAALLYLLLPVIPLSIGYQLVSGWVTGQLRFPTFSADYLVAAFLFAVLLNILLLLAFKQFSIDYSDPVTMLFTLVGSFGLGSAAAAVRRFTELRLFLFWRYRESDSPAEYLRKALLRPSAPPFYSWATGTDSAGNTWSGIQLQQPASGPALGATLQVTEANGAPAARLNQVFDANHRLLPGRPPRRKLIKLLHEKVLRADYESLIEQNGVVRNDLPVITGLEGFHSQAPEARELVTLT